MTQLRSLDLSYNDLEDITSDTEMFRLPWNMSELYLSHNKLHKLPWNHMKNISKMEILDISNNNFENFNMDLTNMVQNGTMVYFEGMLFVSS